MVTNDADVLGVAYQVATRWSWNATERDDLAQIAALRIFHDGLWNESGALQAICARYAIIDALRSRHGRRATSPKRDVHESMLTDNETATDDPVETSLMSDMLTDLSQREQRIVIWLTVGWSQEHIAAVEGVSAPRISQIRDEIHRRISDVTT